MDVTLSFYKPEHADRLNGFVLSEEDKMFSALPKDVLPQALVIRDRYPTVILKEDSPVGFFILHTSKETIAPYSNNVSAILLSALSLHASQQGKGYAKQAMPQLPAFIANYFPWCDEIVLAVNHPIIVHRTCTGLPVLLIKGGAGSARSANSTFCIIFCESVSLFIFSLPIFLETYIQKPIYFK